MSLFNMFLFLFARMKNRWPHPFLTLYNYSIRYSIALCTDVNIFLESPYSELFLMN